jgi:hypothetical protein
MKLLGPTTEVFISDHDGFENMNTWADGVAADAACNCASCSGGRKERLGFIHPG